MILLFTYVFEVLLLLAAFDISNMATFLMDADPDIEARSRDDNVWVMVEGCPLALIDEDEFGIKVIELCIFNFSPDKGAVGLIVVACCC